MQEFNILGKTISFSDAEVNYFAVHKLFSDLSIQVAKIFSKSLNNLKSADEMAEKIDGLAAKAFSAGMEAGLMHLTHNGVYTVGAEQYLKYVGENCLKTWYDAYGEFEEQYAHIVYSQKEMEDYRRLRKETRSQFVGGGFGMKGAISGAVKAEILNGVTGAAHSFVNSVGNARTNAEAEKAKKCLFENQEIRKELVYAVQGVVYLMMYINIQILSEETGALFEIPSNEGRTKANAITENIFANLVPDAQIDNLIVKGLELDPTNSALYLIAIQKRGDENLEIENLANTLGIYINLLDLQVVKEQMVLEGAKDLFSRIKDNSNDAKIVMAAIDEITNVIKYYGLKSSDRIMQIIRSSVDHIEKQQRTVDGVEYDTIEEAGNALKDKEIIKCILDSRDLDTLEGYNDALTVLKGTKFYDEKTLNNIEEILKKEQQLRSKSLLTLGKRLYLMVLDEYNNANFKLEYEHLHGEVHTSTFSKYNIISNVWRNRMAFDESEEILMYINSEYSMKDDKCWGVILTNKRIVLYDGSNEYLYKIPISEIQTVQGRGIDILEVVTKKGNNYSIKLKKSDDKDSIECLANAMNKILEVVKNIDGKLIPLSELEIEERREKSIEITESISIEYQKYCKEMIQRMKRIKGYEETMWLSVIGINDESESFNKRLDHLQDSLGIDFRNNDYPVMFIVNNKNKTVESVIILTAQNIYCWDENAKLYRDNMGKSGYFTINKGLFKTTIKYNSYKSEIYDVNLGASGLRKLGDEGINNFMRTTLYDLKEMFDSYAK